MQGDGQESGLAKRYAQALFELADQNKSLDSIANDLSALKSLLKESDDLQKVITSPLFSREDQSNAMTALAKESGMDSLTLRFLAMVAANRRLFALEQIIDAFLAMLARHRGEITAYVTSAQDLPEDQRKALSDIISKSFGGSVRMKIVTDPKLLAGLVVRVGSKMIDTSMKTKLQRLKLAMKGVG